MQQHSDTLATYRRQDLLTVGEIARKIPGLAGGPCSRRHVYNLIERGELSPAFRFGTRKGICVPRQVVEQYVRRCQVEVGA